MSLKISGRFFSKDRFKQSHRIKQFIQFWRVLWKFKDIRLALWSDIRNIKQVSKSTQFPHYGAGVVIGSDTVIGKNCVIHQNVTMGDRSRLKTGQPIIGNNVEIYTGATILGQITIGDNAVIGAHSLVLHDVEVNSLVFGVPARVQCRK